MKQIEGDEIRERIYRLFPLDLPSESEPIIMCLDAERCAELWGYRRWTDPPLGRFLQDCECFIFVPSSWTIYYLPAIMVAILDRKQALDRAEISTLERLLWCFNEGGELSPENTDFSNEQVDVILCWLAWVGQTYALFGDEVKNARRILRRAARKKAAIAFEDASAV